MHPMVPQLHRKAFCAHFVECSGYIAAKQCNLTPIVQNGEPFKYQRKNEVSCPTLFAIRKLIRAISAYFLLVKFEFSLDYSLDHLGYLSC